MFEGVSYETIHLYKVVLVGPADSRVSDFAFSPTTARPGETAASDTITVDGVTEDAKLAVAAISGGSEFTWFVNGSEGAASVGYGDSFRIEARAGDVPGDVTTIRVTMGEGENAVSADWAADIQRAAVGVRGVHAGSHGGFGPRGPARRRSLGSGRVAGKSDLRLDADRRACLGDYQRRDRGGSHCQGKPARVWLRAASSPCRRFPDIAIRATSRE